MLGFWVWLGAHPFWSAKATYIGIGVGIALSLSALLLTKRFNFSNLAVLLGLVITTALIAAITLLYGKAQFAASYAENAFAGRVWFVGFMGLIGTLFASLIALSDLVVARYSNAKR
jgi:hypothetical protein